MFRVVKSFLSAERGTSIIEFCIGVPFLTMLLFCTIDLGRALERHMAVNKIVYEGLRYGATLPNLEAKKISPGDDTTQISVQNDLRKRVFDLSEKAGFVRSDVQLMTELFKANVVTKDAADADVTETYGRTRVVCVHMSVPFSALFPAFVSLDRLSAGACGPYLFPDQAA